MMDLWFKLKTICTKLTMINNQN